MSNALSTRAVAGIDAYAALDANGNARRFDPNGDIVVEATGSTRARCAGSASRR
ncbi:hypothetical protein [Burkholderia sp. BCC0405]|uniref:hypothetical protein n=1 Tax=Burkholderia sp. BCC0405 TaxID=2676298 RepID=UPI0015898047|nr:hypothetical protein [Burkholderia sp. BCC0405]